MPKSDFLPTPPEGFILDETPMPPPGFVLYTPGAPPPANVMPWGLDWSKQGPESGPAHACHGN
jgi:hypothetical protein